MLRVLTIAAWIALLLAVVGAAGCGGSAEEPAEVVREPLRLPPPPTTVADTLRSGETLAGLLADHGVGPAEAANLAELLRPYADPRSLPPGMEVRITAREREPPSRVDLRLDHDRTVRMYTVGARWTSALDSVEVRRDTVLVGGRVRSNLYTAELFGDAGALTGAEHGRLVHRLSRIFGWEIDFWRDIRPGDAYRVALQRDVRPDGSVRSFRVLAAEYRGESRTHTAIRFHRREGKEARDTARGSAAAGEGWRRGRVEFYDVDGRSLRGAFLQAPLDFVRVTSRFNRRRFHPVLRRTRAHLGVDYGAPTGTRVRATGSGVIARAGWWGGYGRMVEVRHPNGVRTRYAHLSRVTDGIRPGARVAQGQVIGRVGSTGMSTAPHLHYEFLRHGRHLDPRRAPVARAEPVAAEDRPRFDAVRDEALALLSRLGPPATALLAGLDAAPPTPRAALDD